MVASVWFSNSRLNLGVLAVEEEERLKGPWSATADQGSFTYICLNTQTTSWLAVFPAEYTTRPHQASHTL